MNGFEGPVLATNRAVRDAAADHRLVTAGLKAFFKMAKVWKLTEDEQEQILGVGRSTLFKWRDEPPSRLQVETFRAVSLMLAIHALFHKLFPSAPASAMEARVRRVGALWFAPGLSLVDFVVEGGPIAMERVRAYLVHEVGSEVERPRELTLNRGFA